MLEDGEVDMVTSARKTPDREEKFDFSRPIGTNYGMLTVRSDNSTIVDGNYSTYNGMRVALLNGNTRNEEFADFADDKGFTYVPSYFDTTTEMDEVLQSEKVDAIVTSSLRKTNNERIVDKFGSSDFYVIVKKGNTELLNEINYAIDQMNAVEGDWKTTLYNKNYESIETKNLEYTEQEKSIIAQYSKDNPIRVLCDPTRYPYSYNENGEMKGIIPDYFRKIADYAGISYEFLTPVTRDEYIAYQKNKETTDMSIDARLRDVLVNILSNAVKFTPDGNNIPIIAMTANAFAEDVQASLDAGMNAHLSKPIVIDEVIKTILRYVYN